MIKGNRIAKEKKRPGLFHFNRGQLCIPYGLFLVMFVVLPLFVIIYYAFTDASGAFSFNAFAEFFTSSAKVSTLLISIVVSFAVTLICLLIAYPVA
ncbi:MAG: ABC transporter permease, partial [Clostridia bacterium]|nr:ABC transporter permease [Clostridia bacterium]